MSKMEVVSDGAEDVSKVAGAIVAVAMAGTALLWVGSGIKNLAVGIKTKRNAKKAEQKPEVEAEKTA